MRKIKIWKRMISIVSVLLLLINYINCITGNSNNLVLNTVAIDDSKIPVNHDEILAEYAKGNRDKGYRVAYALTEEERLEYRNRIYAYLCNELGFTRAVAIGALNNIYVESARTFNPSVLEGISWGYDDVGHGIGLLQWTFAERNGMLKTFASDGSINGFGKPVSPISLDCQLHYLKWELVDSGRYTNIYNGLLAIGSAGKSDYDTEVDAAYYWCYNFEIPGDRYNQSVYRGTSSEAQALFKELIDIDPKTLKTESSDSNDSSDTANALKSDEQNNEENDIVALSGPEDEIVQQMNTSEKDAYMIIKSKCMTDIELSSMEWNLIVSQFAIPYRENIQDVWNHTSWKDMREKGLIIDDNPYLTSIQDNLRVLNSNALESAIQIGIDITGDDKATVTSYMSDIADCMMESDGVIYSPVYKNGEVAYISDLFENDTYALTIKDKIAVTAGGASKTNLIDALNEMQNDFIYAEKSNEELANTVSGGSIIYDISLPVWLNTDATMMYNNIYVANAIRIGGYGNYKNFINSVGNSQLYIDRWGNLCAYLKIDGNLKYTIVYPAYSNPIFISTEINNEDFAGYVYENFDDENLYRTYNSNDKFWNNSVINTGINNLLKDGNNNSWGEKTIVGIDPMYVAKNYKQIKNDYISESLDNLNDNDYLGVENARSIRIIEAKSSNGTVLGGVFNRVRSSFKQERDIIPVMELDTTDNMIFNKAILSAYTRDSYSKVSKQSNTKITDYYNGNWYKSLNDSNNTYSIFDNFSKYNYNRQDALFSNSIIFDKYYTNIMMGGAKTESNKKGYKPSGYTLQESCTAIGVSDWIFNDEGNNTGYFKIQNQNSYVHNNIVDGLSIKDSTKADISNLMAIYPFMQMHSYRKSIYSDTPSMQATKTKTFKGSLLGINMVIADRYVSESYNYENVVTTKSDSYRAGSLGGTDSKVPIEIYWDAMYTDSDKFKTYVIFNYTNESVPDNSVTYGMGRRLSKNNQGNTYFFVGYIDANLSGNKTMGRNYMSIPIFDATIDTGISWNIWNDIDNSSFVDSVQKEPRKRTMPTRTTIGDMGIVKNATFFEPIAITGNNQESALRYILNDQRVSDVLENYPLEDITLLSFVWRNYYTPQTPFRTKLNRITRIELDENNYKIDDKEDNFIIGEDNFLPENVVLTPYSAISEDNSKVNNTLLWTQSCSSSKEHQLSLEGITNTGSGVGEVDKLYADTPKIYRASVNFGILILAVNKNTQGDNLVNLVSGYDARRDFDEKTIMNSISEFFTHPVTSLANIYLGFIQLIHNNIAVGNIGNIFDISWIIDTILVNNILVWIMVISTIMITFILIVRGFIFMYNKKQNFMDLLREWGATFCLAVVPVVAINMLSNGLHLMSTSMTKNVAGQLATIEIEKEVTASEKLNINFETVYSAYKEQFDDIKDSYNRLTMKVPVRFNNTTNKLEYEEVTIKSLYDTIEYSNVLADAKLESQKLEAVSPEGSNFIDIYRNQNPGVSSMYYSYSEFVPVNYEHYDENIFYYFYDYIKYQYLAYWASQSDANSTAYSASARKFSLPCTEKGNEELWGSYINRMWDAEVYMLQKSYNGTYLMYHDNNYVYNKLYNDNGKPVYNGAYVTDMFGLSYLFNMTDGRNSNKGYLDSPSIEYINALKNNSEESLTQWQIDVKDNFKSSLGNYGSYFRELQLDTVFDYDTIVPPFYPLAYLMDNPIWQSMKVNTKMIVDNPASIKLEDYKFTPSYLEDKFADTSLYDGYIKISDMNVDNHAMSYGSDYRTSDTLKYENLIAKRMPWRLYASKSVLYSNTYDGKHYNNYMTDLESALESCTENTYKKIKNLTEYLQGDIRDSSLIFASAIIATMEFNKTFSSKFYTDNRIDPQSYTEDSMDLDKLMRVTYAKSIDDIVKNPNVMYMIFEQDGGLVTATIMTITEILIAITMLTRIAVLLMMLIGCSYVCYTFAFYKEQDRKSMIVGIVSQLLQICFSQFILLFIITQAMNFISYNESSSIRILVSLFMLIVCYALMKWSLYMLLSIIKSYKTFGGAIIQGSVNSMFIRIQATYTDIKNNKELKDISAVIGNANVKENIYQNKIEEEKSRRKVNTKKMEDNKNRKVKDIESINKYNHRNKSNNINKTDSETRRRKYHCSMKNERRTNNEKMTLNKSDRYKNKRYRRYRNSRNIR